MTTVRQATRHDVEAPSPTPAPAARPAPTIGVHAARDHQRRMRREQLLAAVVLLVLLGATTALLGVQWLGGSGPSPSTPPPITDTGGAP